MRWPLVAVGSLLALGVPHLVSGGIGAGLAALGLGLAPATALFAACGYGGCATLLGRGPRGDLDSYASLAEIGAAIVLAAMLAVWRRGTRAAPGPRGAGALGILLALAGFCFAAHAAGLKGESARWSASLVSSPVLAFALAGCASRERTLALLAAYVALRLPESCGWLAGPAALALALVAAEALETAPREARALGATACALLAALALLGNPQTPVAAAGEPLDAQDEFVQWRRTGEFEYAVVLDPRAPVSRALLVFVSESDGQRVERPVRAAQLRDPAWRVQLELFGPTGAQAGVRVIDRVILPQAPALSPALGAFLAAALILCFVREGGARLALVAALLAAAQSAWLYVRA